MTRWKAFAIHLVISLVILAGLAALFVTTWYRDGLLQFARADRLLGLIVSVDLIIGPLLTLIVYKKGKRTLKFDLASIAVMQSLFLAYGLQTVWLSRPVYLVAMPHRMELVFAPEIEEADIRPSFAGHFTALPAFGPVLVGAEPSSDAGVRARQVKNWFDTGKDISVLPEFYVPYSQVKDRLLDESKPLSSLEKLFRDHGQNTPESLTGLPDNTRWVLLRSSRGMASMLLDSQGQPIKTVGYPVGSITEE